MELNGMPRLPCKQPILAWNSQDGMTLVEIMIALVIGLVLTAGVAQIFLSGKQTYRLQDGQSRLQENARYALELLTNDIRQAGYSGCANLSSIIPRVIADGDPNPDGVVDFTVTAASAVSGNDAATSSWNPALSSTLIGKPLAGTDVITVQYSQGCGAHLTGNMDAANANIQIMESNSCSIDAGDALMISDCVAADVFRAVSASSAAGKQTITHSSAKNTDPLDNTRSSFLSKPYQADAEIFGFTSRTYYVATGAGGQPSLWRLDNPAVELVEGVENMQILYGEDTDGDRIPNQYRKANNVINLANVVSVRVSLLMQTLDNNLLQLAQRYNYNDVAVTATDRRLRHVFTTTVDLRNRSP
jgi:type IV pilus assembly protein PilW